MSDNGKSFEFGYDSENDTYGYYKDGVFTEFGGGGLSSKCLVKGMVLFTACIGSTYFRNAKMSYYNDDGDYGNITSMDNYSSFITNADFIGSCTFSNQGNYYATIFAPTAGKDGFYMWGCGTLFTQFTPVFYRTGDTLFSVPNTSGFTGQGDPCFIAYCGLEV